MLLRYGKNFCKIKRGMAASCTQLSCCRIVVQYSCSGKTLSKEVPSTRSPTVSTTATLTFWRCHTIIQKGSKKVNLICKGPPNLSHQKTKKRTFTIFCLQFTPPSLLFNWVLPTLPSCNCRSFSRNSRRIKRRPRLSASWWGGKLGLECLMHDRYCSNLWGVYWLRTNLTKQWTARKMFTLM